MPATNVRWSATTEFSYPVVRSRCHAVAFKLAILAIVGMMKTPGEVGEFGLNHIPAKNAACESGPEGSNPSLSAINTERLALGVGVLRGEALALLD